MIDIAALNKLPQEMRERERWCIAGPDPKGSYKAPYVADMTRMASVTNPNDWTDFETAVERAALLGGEYGVGYVLTADDGICIVDADVKPDSPQEHVDRVASILNVFPTYSEISRSGLGLHIICKAKSGKGARRDGIEIYSQERFMVCTGNVVKDLPLADCQVLIDNMLLQMPRSDGAEELEELPQEISDVDVYDRLMRAFNGEKFNQLCKGDWQSMGYPSQSEADLALMSMFAFVSRSNEQCRRMFRQSGLGQREKATKNDVYLNRTLSEIRARQKREDIGAAHGAAVAAAIMANTTPSANQFVPPVPAPVTPESAGDLEFPPGAMGAIAQYIYSCASRPVKEVSIAAALGLIAGIAGRTYQLPGSGLNLYIVLIARSAIGKEAMHTGLSQIVSQLQPIFSSIDQHVIFKDFASGPALIKEVAEHSCFVSVSGEWGKRLRELAKEGAQNSSLAQLRTVMTNLYQKSGAGTIVSGIAYSNKEGSVNQMNTVAYSMIGETTPGAYYESLTESMMEDGFLSRFTTIEYRGDRPDMNLEPQRPMDQQLLYRLGDLVHAATAGAFVVIKFSSEAQKLLWEFNKECDERIRGSQDEGHRQMWNRAHLKALRISGLMAAVDNPHSPTIYEAHAVWAIQLIRADIYTIKRRIDEGDVGQGDTSRDRKLLNCITDYFTKPIPASYGVPDVLVKAGIITHKYFYLRVQKVASFTTHRLGGKAALDLSIKSLIDSGFLQEVDKNKLAVDYGFHGKAFRVLSQPHLPDA